MAELLRNEEQWLYVDGGYVGACTGAEVCSSLRKVQEIRVSGLKNGVLEERHL